MDDVASQRRRLLSRLEHKPKLLKGDKYLIEILYHYNRYILSSKLKNLWNQQGKGSVEIGTDPEYQQPESGISFGYSPLSIEITDEVTIEQCKAMLIDLIAEEAELDEWNDIGRLADIRREKEGLIRYLTECLTANGTIVKISDQQIADYRHVQKAIKRCRDSLAKTEPDLAILIDEHLETGVYCIWREAV